MRSGTNNLTAEAGDKMTCKSIGGMDDMANVDRSSGRMYSIGEIFRPVVWYTYRLYRGVGFNIESVGKRGEQVLPDRHGKSVGPDSTGSIR